MKKDVICKNKVAYFIQALKERMNNNNLVIKVSIVHEKQAKVYIGSMCVGLLIAEYLDSYSFSNFPENTHLFFLPYMSLFPYLNQQSVYEFTKRADELAKSFCTPLNMRYEQYLEPRKLANCVFHPTGKNTLHSATFEGFLINVVEYLSIMFQLVNVDNNFKLIDYFSMHLTNESSKNYDKQFNLIPDNETYHKELSIILRKTDENYHLFHNHERAFHSIEFDRRTPSRFNEFVSVIFNYTIMSKHNIEIPTVEDFLLNMNSYKKLIEIVDYCD